MLEKSNIYILVIISLLSIVTVFYGLIVYDIPSQDFFINHLKVGFLSKLDAYIVYIIVKIVHSFITFMVPVFFIIIFVSTCLTIQKNDINFLIKILLFVISLFLSSIILIYIYLIVASLMDPIMYSLIQIRHDISGNIRGRPMFFDLLGFYTGIIGILIYFLIYFGIPYGVFLILNKMRKYKIIKFIFSPLFVSIESMMKSLFWLLGDNNRFDWDRL